MVRVFFYFLKKLTFDDFVYQIYTNCVFSRENLSQGPPRDDPEAPSVPGGRPERLEAMWGGRGQPNVAFLMEGLSKIEVPGTQIRLLRLLRK